ncbi:Coiled-coil domain-containing protein 93 [Orchesella cincta]|uniref:Coiled-coil domain-containing protein 93 n=1 Tax=Orchesella cincta TaxID=48709 RepID=A0A1D2NEZ0_ORCCI|nr:Coiled-coil domain-containing protein 93 [Orchesella cincta]
MADCSVEKPASVDDKNVEKQDEFSNGAVGSDQSRPTVSSSGSGLELIDAVIAKNKQLDESLSKYDAEILEKEQTLQELQSQLEDLQTKSVTLDDEMKSLSESSSENNELAREIEKYLAIYERLKSDEKLFKASCNEELIRLQKELESLNTDSSDGTKTDLGTQLERSTARLEAGRIELAGINRKVAAIKRQIEQVPNRMELREYRLRFSELYNQVSATHRSTKQFFSLYNSLEDTKRYLEKELSLLNSIVDSYQLASTSASGREEFLRQLQSINEGMRESCSKVEKRYQIDKSAVETLQAEIQRLLDVKVAYEKCLLELEAECKRNEKLLAECKAVEA